MCAGRVERNESKENQTNPAGGNAKRLPASEAGLLVCRVEAQLCFSCLFGLFFLRRRGTAAWRELPLIY